jgi:lysyl-tRNA synthetase class 2
MPSSVIARISHDAPKRILHVRFVSGRDYAYFGVPRRVYDAFRTAPSKGKFFNRRIRDRYPFRETPESRTASQTHDRKD